MTIKEAFKIIYEKEDIQGGHDEWWKAVRIIEKNLEVLKILKKHSTRLSDEDWHDNIFNGIDYEELNYREIKKVKEWLEK